MTRQRLFSSSSPQLVIMRSHFIIFGSVLILSLNLVTALDPLETDEEVFQADRLNAEAQTEYPNGVNVIPGEAETDYPVYHTIPKTSFSCEGRIPGFYADVEARCQAWHNCDIDSRMQTFLCPNGTIYSQTKRVCEWWYNVNCNPTEVSRYYEQNRDLFISPRDQIPDDIEGGKQKNALISNSGPTKPRQQQPQQHYNQNQGQQQQQQNYIPQNQGSRPPPQQHQQQQNNFNQNQGPRSQPPPQQQQQNNNYNQQQQQNNYNQQQQNFNQGPPRSPPPPPPPQQQQQRQQQQPQQSRPQQQVPSHLSAIVQASTGAVPQSTRQIQPLPPQQQQQPQPQQPRRHPGDGQNFNRQNEFQNQNQNRGGNQVNRNYQQSDNQQQQNYQQDNQQQQYQDNQQNNNQRGQQQQPQQQQYRQNPDNNQQQQQRRPIEERPIPQASRPVQNSAPINRPPQQQQIRQEQRPNNSNNVPNEPNPTPAPAQAFFIPPQMRFRHSTPRKHNIKFTSPRQQGQYQEDESRERQIPQESQQQGFPYSQLSPQTYSRNFNEFVIPNSPYVIQNEQYREPSPSTFSPPQPQPQRQQQRSRSNNERVPTSSPQQQQQQEIPTPTARQVPQQRSNTRGQPNRENYQDRPEQRTTTLKEVQRPIPSTTAAPRRIPTPDTATTYRPNPGTASRIVVKSRLENKYQPHEVRDGRPRNINPSTTTSTSRPIPQYPAPLDSSEEEEAVIHSQYISGGKTYGTKQ